MEYANSPQTSEIKTNVFTLHQNSTSTVNLYHLNCKRKHSCISGVQILKTIADLSGKALDIYKSTQKVSVNCNLQTYKAFNASFTCRDVNERVFSPAATSVVKVVRFLTKSFHCAVFLTKLIKTKKKEVGHHRWQRSAFPPLCMKHFSRIEFENTCVAPFPVGIKTSIKRDLHKAEPTPSSSAARHFFKCL